MAMPPTGFPRLALHQIISIHYDGENMIFVDMNGSPALTLAFYKGALSRFPYIYQHSLDEQDENLHDNAQSGDETPIPF